MQKIILLLISFTIIASGQQVKIEGLVVNKSNNTPLSFATLRVLGTNNGNTSNLEGRFRLNVNSGKYKIAASFIGFISDTLEVNAQSDIDSIVIALNPVSLDLPEVTILPGKNPALEIISKAIKRKKEREENINNFKFNAYTKGVIRTDKDLNSDEHSVTLQTGKEADSVAMSIKGILENQSIGYFVKPDKYKEFITAQKQSANIPSSINILTGGRIIQNFYSDDIRFFDRPLPGPIANNALNYYYFYIQDTLAQDNDKIYKIFFAPDNDNDPGFTGNVFIKDSTFDLIKVDAQLNRPANPGGLFDTVRIFQQFLSYNDNIYMPIDYRLFVKANLLGLIRIGFEINSILYDYQINENINKEIFDKAIVTVLPDADKKDSSFWTSNISVPNTIEELTAYKQIDSIRAIPRTFWSGFPGNLLSSGININDNFSISAPLGMYHFNRVEGHTLDFALNYDDTKEKRLASNFDMHYGFADKKLKSELYSRYLFGDYRTYKLEGRAFNKIGVLFNESDSYGDFVSTILTLFTKYEYRDYYYSKGFELGFSGDVFPVLNLGLKFMNRTDNSAYVNSNYSFFAKKKKYKDNQEIYDTKLNSLKFSFNFDFRNYIENGYFRNRVDEGKSFILFGGDIELSNSVLGSKLDFARYGFKIYGELNTFRSAKFLFKLNSSYSDGPVPYQMLRSLAGNIDNLSESFSFRTARFGEYFGDKIVTLNIEHDFNDELFRLFRIPFFEKSEILLSGHFNIGWTKLSDKSANIIPYKFTELKNPLMEAGFGIGHMLLPVKFEFTWRLNHLEGTKFVFGLNALVL